MDPPAETSRVAESEPTTRQSRGKPGVLVVDDEHLVRVVVQMGLERAGFEVWTAANGREAIDLYRKHGEAIAVVVLDMRMPGPDGPQTLDGLRQLNPEVRVCLMSGDTGDYDPEELRRRGAAHLIAKPFCVNELTDALRILTHGVPAERLAPGGGCPG
jgi:CheY-like chemotaxis protein